MAHRLSKQGSLENERLANRRAFLIAFKIVSAYKIGSMKKLLLFTMILGCMLTAVVPAQAQQVVKVTEPCPLTTKLDSFTATTQLLAAPGNAKQRYIICAIYFTVVQAAGAADFGIVSSTTSGNACATAPVTVTPQWSGTASVKETRDITFPHPNTIKIALASALCAKLSAAPTKAQIIVQYGLQNTP